MSKFKIGDKVRVIIAPEYIPEIEGEVGTVIDVCDPDVYPVMVRIDGERYNLAYNEIEHVREDCEERRTDANMEKQFNMGDIVRVVKTVDNFPFPEIENREGTVITVRDQGAYPVTVQVGIERYDLSYDEIEHVRDDSDNGYNKGDRVLVKNFGDYMQCEILSDGFYYAGAKRYVVRSISEDIMRIINENQITEILTNNDN